MGAKCFELFAFFFVVLSIQTLAFPVDNLEVKKSNENAADNTPAGLRPQLLAVTFTVCCVLVLLGCLSCCKQRAGFKEFQNELTETNNDANNVVLDFVNPLQNAVERSSRYSIFSSIVVAEANVEKQPDSVVTFEPLPKVLPNQIGSDLRLPYSNVGNVNDVSFFQDWLGDKDFPRQQLHYLRECGQGWFGKVVEGEARGILSPGNKVYRVVVRILKEEATVTEKALFLQEAKPYRDLTHPNMLRLLGRCLENVPFLLLFETCTNGDLKNYLKQHAGNRDALIFQGIILRMAVDTAAGLSYMLQHGYVHTDIATRNCLVTNDLRVKIGDYGTSLQTYRDEYYVNGGVAIPIRWCAPETLHCTENVIEPKQVTGASCIWSYGVLLWELEEWGELPYRELTDEQVISRVFGQGYRLSYPSARTPYTREMYNIMQECWKDHVDRPSFIHVTNGLSALMHRFKNADFDSRWRSSKPNTIPVTDNGDGREIRLVSKYDNDSGIDLNNAARGYATRQRYNTADEPSSESPSSSRRFSYSSTGDPFSSPVSSSGGGGGGKYRSPSLENLHGSLDNVGVLNRRISGDETTLASTSKNARVDFQLGPVTRDDASILWINRPLFHTDSYVDENSLTKRVDSLGTDAEDEVWRKRIERGEFTEKVKEKSKSVADLMVLTHIECSESSESDSLPSFHSRQSSFNRHNRRASKNAAASVAPTAATAAGGPLSLFNSLSFGSESNLPAVEKDREFEEQLKKIQLAKKNGDGPEESATKHKDTAAEGKCDNFLSNEASENERSNKSSHEDGYDERIVAVVDTGLPLVDSYALDRRKDEERGDIIKAKTIEDTTLNVTVEEQKLQKCSIPKRRSFLNDSTMEESASSASSSTTYSDNEDSVVIGPSECDTLEYFKGLKTILVEEIRTSPEEKPDDDVGYENEGPRTLDDFLNEAGDDYFYKCDETANKRRERADGAGGGGGGGGRQCCDYCYAKCHFSSSECLRCKSKSSEDEHCSCESYENLEKLRDCATSSCPFQSDDSGRGTDQINSGDGSSDKSLEGSISVQMNEVKNRLENVIAKISGTEEFSDDNCSSLEDDRESNKLSMVDEYAVEEARNGEITKTEDENENTSSSSSESANGSRTFVNVESLFFNVDPKFEKEIDEELNRSSDSFTKMENCNAKTERNEDEYDDDDEDEIDDSWKCSDFDNLVQTNLGTCLAVEPYNDDISNVARHNTSLADDQDDNCVEYEISDILEGLSAEPVSLPYSVNGPAVVERLVTRDGDDDDANESLSNGWLPSPVDENDCKRSLEMDETFVEAIRNELREKLPNIVSSSNCEEATAAPAVVEQCDETNANIIIEYGGTYPAQLSPIVEEDEYEEEEELGGCYSSLSSSSSSSRSESSETINCCSNNFVGEDVLIVDTNTNEASLMERASSLSSPQQQPPSSVSVNSSSSYSMAAAHKLNETYDIDDNDDTLNVNTDDNTLDSDCSFASPDSLSPATTTSSKTGGAHLSYSSSECGNLSDVFLSPSSSTRNFDEFESNDDRTPTTDEKRHVNTAVAGTTADGDTLQSCRDDYEKAISNIDEMLKKTETPRRPPIDYGDWTATPTDNGENWLRTFFGSPNGVGGETASLIEFDAKTEAAEFQSLPADYKSQHWPSVDELTKKPVTTAAAVAAEEANATTATNGGGDCDDDVVRCATKIKNSRALFGNTSKKIRNFQVSVVDENEHLTSRAKTSPTTTTKCMDAYTIERLGASTSPISSEQTWKSSLNAFFGSPNLEKLRIKEANVNDMLMSTSFIENGSREGSVDGKEDEEAGSSDQSEDEGVESTSEEFVWKNNDQSSSTAREINETAADGVTESVGKVVYGAEDEEEEEDDEEDDEELTDFVPFSWNCEAVPYKSALKNENQQNDKKNVSFKKQKYHCVYEYPREEANYPRRYDSMLLDHMNYWNLTQEYLYNDYTSFSDWELEDGEGVSTSSDDMLHYGTIASPQSNKNASKRLGFYTFGAYDIDCNTRSEEISPNGASSNVISSPVTSSYAASNAPSPSPSSSSSPLHTVITSCTATVDCPEKNTANATSEEFTFEKLKLSGNSSSSSSPPNETSEYQDLPSPGLGEMRHAKSRLTLDLTNKTTNPYLQTEVAGSMVEKSESSSNENKNEISDQEDDFGDYSTLKYNACDLSPVVELKPLTSTSVA